jgi:hypothetical protein
MRLDFTLTLPGMFEVKNMQDLAQELDVDILAKVVFGFTPDIIMSPLALPRALLEPWVDELLLYGPANAMHDILIQLKNRPTFEEQWPDQYQAGLTQGKRRVLELERIRSAKTNMSEILSARPEIGAWYESIEA